MILEVHHTVSVPPSSHGAAEAHLSVFLFILQNSTTEVFQSRKKMHVREQHLFDAR